MHCGFHLGIGSVFIRKLWFLHGIGSVVFGILDIGLGIKLVKDLLDLLHKETMFSHPVK